MAIEIEPPKTIGSISESDWAVCTDVLRRLVETPEAALNQEELERLVAKIYKKARKERRKRSALQRADHDRVLVEETGRVRQDSSPDHPAEAGNQEFTGFRSLRARSRDCYICKQGYREVHHFYHMLCPACARLNWAKRELQIDLPGRVALVTGGRIKIGYQTALKLLRCGADVAVTTRQAERRADGCRHCWAIPPTAKSRSSERMATKSLLIFASTTVGPVAWRRWNRSSSWKCFSSIRTLLAC